MMKRASFHVRVKCIDSIHIHFASTSNAVYLTGKMMYAIKPVVDITCTVEEKLLWWTKFFGTRVRDLFSTKGKGVVCNSKINMLNVADWLTKNVVLWDKCAWLSSLLSRYHRKCNFWPHLHFARGAQNWSWVKTLMINFFPPNIPE